MPMLLPRHSIQYGAAQSVAKGIFNMINQNTGETVHVLNYPDLTVKEANRIVYYDGEAALACQCCFPVIVYNTICFFNC